MLTSSGIPGDRIVHVRGPEGVRTSRRHFKLLGLRGSLDGQGRPLIDGMPWDSVAALAAVRRAAGDDAEFVADIELARFDSMPLLVATDGAVAAFGRDVRRLRPNILVGGVEGMAERALNAYVKREGLVRVGDPVTLVLASEAASARRSAYPNEVSDAAHRARQILSQFIAGRAGGRPSTIAG